MDWTRVFYRERLGVLLFGLVVMIGMIGCGVVQKFETKKTGTIVESIKIIQAKVNEVSNIYEGEESVSWWLRSGIMGMPLYAASLTSAWDDISMVALNDPEKHGDYKVTIKKYMSIQFDEDSINPNDASTNVFGRINGAYEIFCALGLGITDVDEFGYPTNGVHDLEITTAFSLQIKTECDIDMEEALIGTTISLSVEDTADTTLFDKKITMSISEYPHVFYIRQNDNFINVASGEESVHGEYRTVVLYNISTKVLRAEYISADAEPNPTYMHFYRVYSDETNNIGYILAREGGSATDYNMYVLSGHTDGTGSIALSFSVSEGSNPGSMGAVTNLNACINSSTGVIVSDNTLSCDGGVDISSYPVETVRASIVDDVVNNNDKAGWKVINEATGNINFSSGSDVFTAAFTIPSN